MWWQTFSLLVIGALELQARSLKSPAGSLEQLPSEMYDLLDKCSDFCKNASRSCLSPPSRCGSCLTDFVERDGLCFQRFNPADEVDTWAQFVRSSNTGEGESNQGEEESKRHQAGNLPPATDSEEELSESDLLMLEGGNNDSPEREEDSRGNELVRDEKAEKAMEQNGETGDEKVIQIDENKFVEIKKPENVFESNKADVFRIHSMPTPAAMIQYAVKSTGDSSNPLSEFYTLAIVVGCAVVSIFVLVGAGLCYYRYQQNAKAAGVVDYPAHGPAGVAAGTPREQRAGSGDRKLAQSAQMYHYQHQKQQMIAAERASDELNKDEESEEEENEEGDYTVYECPGLAPTGEMEVKNPLFAEESTTVANGSGDSPKKD